MQRFSRKHILNYIAPTESHAADELPPSWKADSEASLNWGAPENYALPSAPPAAPIESFPAQQPSQQPAMPVQRAPASPAQQPTGSGLPPDLLRLMEIHEGRRERLKQEAEQRRAQRLADENAVPKPPPLTQRHRASFEYVKPLVQDDEPTPSPQDDNAPDDWSDEDDPDAVNTEGDVQAALPSLTAPAVQPSRDETSEQPDETSSDNSSQDTPPETFSPPFETAAPPAKREPGDSVPPVQRTALDVAPSPMPPAMPQTAVPLPRESEESEPAVASPIQVTSQADVALPRESEGSEPSASTQSSFDAAPVTPDQPIAQRGEGETHHRAPQPNSEILPPLSQPDIVRRAPESQGTLPSAPPLQRRETAPVTPNAQPIQRAREAAPTPPTIRRLPAKPTPPTPAATPPESPSPTVQRFMDVEADAPVIQQRESSVSSPDVSRESTTPQPVRRNLAPSSQRTIQRSPTVLDVTSSIQSAPAESGVLSGESRIETPAPTDVPHAPSSGASETASQWQPSPPPSPTVQRVIETGVTLPDTSAARQLTSQVENASSEPAQNTAHIGGMPLGQDAPVPPQAPIVQRSVNEPSTVGQAAPPAESGISSSLNDTIHPLQSTETPQATSTASVQRMPEAQANHPLAPSRTQRAAAPPTVQRITTPPEVAQTEQAGWRFAAAQPPVKQDAPAQPPRPSTLPELPLQTQEAPAQREIQRAPEQRTGTAIPASVGTPAESQPPTTESTSQLPHETLTPVVRGATVQRVQRAPEPMLSSTPDVIPASISPEATIQHEIQRAPEQQLATPQPSTEPVVLDTEPAWHPPVTPPPQPQPTVQPVPELELPQPAAESAESTPQRGNVQRVAAVPSPVEISSVEAPATPPADHEPVAREVDTMQAADMPKLTSEEITSPPPVSETGLQRMPEPAREVQPASGAQAIGTDLPVAPPASTSQRPEAPATVQRVVEQAAVSPVREMPQETIATTADQPDNAPTVVPQRSRPQTKQPTIQRAATARGQSEQRAETVPQSGQGETPLSSESQPSVTSPQVTPAPVSMQRQTVSTSAAVTSPAPMTPHTQPNIRRVPAKSEQGELVSPALPDSMAVGSHAQLPNATTNAVSQPSIQRNVDAPVSDTSIDSSGMLPVDTPTTTVATPPHTPAIRRVAAAADPTANPETTPRETSTAASPQFAPVNIQRTHGQLTTPSAAEARTIRGAAANLDPTTESTRETTPTIEHISAAGEAAASTQHVQRLAHTQAKPSPTFEAQSVMRRISAPDAETGVPTSPANYSAQETNHVTRVVQREASPLPTSARRVMFGDERSESATAAESRFQNRTGEAALTSGGESVSPDFQPSGTIQRSKAVPAVPVTPPLETRQPAPLNAFEAYARASAESDIATPAVQRVPLLDEPQSVDEGLEAADDTMPQNLYEAMVSSGMLPISSMPQSGGESGVMRRATPRDPRVSSAITEMPSATRQADQTVVPDANSTEAELLGLLGLPPDTPVVGMKPTPPAPAVQRTSAMSTSEPSAPAVQRAPAAPASASDLMRDPQSSSETPDVTPAPPAQVQRAIGEATADRQAESSEVESEEQDEAVDIERLAQQVFSILRQRLRIERERRDR